MARRTRATVDQNAMRAMFRPGGQIHQFADKVRDDVRDSARRKAPKRTGLLKASMGSDRIGSNGYQCRITVYNTAPYAQHVEWNTVGTIKFVRLYAGGRPAPAQFAHTVGQVMPGVEGYPGKHFMRDGLLTGLRKNRIRVV